MADEEGKGVTRTDCNAARLRNMLHKCQVTNAHGSKETYEILSGGDPSGTIVCETYDSDEEECHCPDPPADVPVGHFGVLVGSERRRFVIPTSYLSLPVFKVLLEKVEEEFGFENKGALTFPCEIETFKYLLKCMERHR